MTGPVRPLRYVPFGPELDGVPHVFVDGLRTADTVLELSHWPGNRTPAPFKADVSTQSVLALLASDHAAEELAGAEAVTCDHYDVDGLLSVWCLTAPREALARRRLVEQTAVTGDFDTWTSAEAVRACLAIDAAERRLAAELAEHPLGSTDEVSAAFFRGLLDRLPELLDDPAAVDGWQPEFERAAADLGRLARHPELVREQPALDLAVVDPGAGLHPFAVNAHTERLRVLGNDGEGRYWLRQRYESFVDLRSRRTAPRVRGDLLAAELNRRESGGTWMCEPPDTATPVLQLYAPTGTPAVSSLTWSEFAGHALDFLERAGADAGLRWERDSDWYRTSDVLPPSAAPAS